MQYLQSNSSPEEQLIRLKHEIELRDKDIIYLQGDIKRHEMDIVSLEQELKIIKNKTFWSEFRVPFYTAITTAFIGIFIAYSWEYFKFRRETLFVNKIELIKDNRENVSNIYVEFDRLRRTIRSNEAFLKTENDCNSKNFESQIEELKSIGLRVNHLKVLSKGFENEEQIFAKVEIFKEDLKQYLSCLENNNNCSICTDMHPKIMTPLNDIIQVYTELLNKEIQ
jgi:hypothetical protein